MILSEHVTISRDLATRILEIFNQGWIPTKEFMERKEELKQAMLKEVTPKTIQLKEGCWYERRDGEIVGPAKRRNKEACIDFKWIVGEHIYKDNGRWRSCETSSLFDLIREVPAPVPNWTNERCEQLDKLKDLLNYCRALNKGSHVIERMQRVIQSAHDLREFTRFLNDMAIAERTQAKEAK